MKANQSLKATEAIVGFLVHRIQKLSVIEETVVHPPTSTEHPETHPLPSFTPVPFTAMSFDRNLNNNLSYDNSSAADDRFNPLNWENDTAHQYADASIDDNGWYHHSLNAGNPSQPYTGLGDVGGTGSFMDLNGPVTTPAASYLTDRVSHGGDKPCCSS